MPSLVPRGSRETGVGMYAYVYNTCMYTYYMSIGPNYLEISDCVLRHDVLGMCIIFGHSCLCEKVSLGLSLLGFHLIKNLILILQDFKTRLAWVENRDSDSASELVTMSVVTSSDVNLFEVKTVCALGIFEMEKKH